MLDDTSNPKNADTNHAAQHKYLSFILGQEEYAIEILRVKEIIEFGEITPVPMMPRFMRGAHNLRGHLVPIIDLAARLETEAKERSARTGAEHPPAHVCATEGSDADTGSG